MKKTIGLSLLAFSSLFADAELDAIKEQLKQQQLIMKKLQEKVMQLTQKSEAKEQNRLEAKMAGKSDSSSSFSQNAYLPDIAMVLNMSAVNRDVKNSDYENYAIPGFIGSGDAEIPFNKDRGFNLNYAEIAMSSTVDPYFDAFAIFHLQAATFEIEEAYVRTRTLPYGLKVKAGKFKSDFGRINSIHQHAWNFDSQPIVYEALVGPESISDPGIQLQWVAPTDTYLMAGVEAMQGTNDISFGNTEGNNLYIGYLKSSVDIGDDLSILGGVSLAHGENAQNNSINPTDIYGADLTLRKELGSYSSLIWQSEYLYRNKDIGDSTDKQAGFYSELVYHKDKNYSGGIRYDAIVKNDTDLNSNYAGINTDNLDRYTAMLEYKPFPMSRLRLQYTYDRTKVIDGLRKDISEVVFSLNIAAGAHGAHSY
jgi:uncharacterized coiled-coil protein SlyX